MSKQQTCPEFLVGKIIFKYKDISKIADFSLRTYVQEENDEWFYTDLSY